MREVFNFFSQDISNSLENNLKTDEINNIEEIRLRSNGKLIVKTNEMQRIIPYEVKIRDIIESLQIMCNNSIYSFQNQINNGFLTVKGGHRVGIAGNCVIENSKVINIKHISSINFRIAREVIGCGNSAICHIINHKLQSIYYTLIVSPPGIRKNNNTKRYYKKCKLRNS